MIYKYTKDSEENITLLGNSNVITILSPSEAIELRYCLDQAIESKPHEHPSQWDTKAHQPNKDNTATPPKKQTMRTTKIIQNTSWEDHETEVNETYDRFQESHKILNVAHKVIENPNPGRVSDQITFITFIDYNLN